MDLYFLYIISFNTDKSARPVNISGITEVNKY